MSDLMFLNILICPVCKEDLNEGTLCEKCTAKRGVKRKSGEAWWCSKTNVVMGFLLPSSQRFLEIRKRTSSLWTVINTKESLFVLRARIFFSNKTSAKIFCSNFGDKNGFYIERISKINGLNSGDRYFPVYKAHKKGK